MCSLDFGEIACNKYPVLLLLLYLDDWEEDTNQGYGSSGWVWCRDGVAGSPWWSARTACDSSRTCCRDSPRSRAHCRSCRSCAGSWCDGSRRRSPETDNDLVKGKKKGKGSFLYSAISGLLDRSKSFTLFALPADLFIPTPTRLLWEAF